MSESSDKESAFGLSGEQLERLLSIGYGKDQDVEEPPSSTNASDHESAPGAVKGSESILQIDGYEIIEKVAEAGQGQVWHALQQSTNRHVAIKVPKLGTVISERARIRFEREIELAARLKHPNIARIYDSGINRGQYYYVMDFVEGLKLDEYVRKHRLTHRQILELMRTICQAIQHAHQKGIIHRDLKPSNIMVTDDGRPFIVDFGLAKGFFEDDQNLVVSVDGETVGTPAYMSPEQAAGHTDKVDTRTDVYSLGVTLFTLLTGSNPHDLSGTRLEVMHRIAEREVIRPRTLKRDIDKDIETLLLKALDRDPDRRYSSAAGLAEDIDNYLKGEPLIAGSPSNVYRLKKLIKRNKLPATSIAVVLVVLIGGIIFSTIFALGQARARAEAQSIADFLTKDVLGTGEQIKGRDATIIDLLDAAGAKLDAGVFKGQPLIEASIRWTLRNIYTNLGHHKREIPHLERVREISIEQGDRLRAPTRQIIMNCLGLSYRRAGRYDDAIARYQEWMRQNPKYPPYFNVNIASVYNNQGRYEEAEHLLVETWNRDYKDGEVPGFVITLAEIYHAQGRYEEAEQQLIRALEERKSKPKGMVSLMRELAGVYMDQGRYRDANDLFVRAIETGRRELPGMGHPRTLRAVNGLAVLHTRLKQYEDADRLFHEAWEGRRDKLGDDHPETLQTINDLGILHRQQQHYEQAERLLTEALEGRKLKLGADHPHTLQSMHELAILYKEQGDFEKAESLLREAVEGRRLKLGDTHPHTLESWRNLIELYEAWGKPEQASQWRARGN